MITIKNLSVDYVTDDKRRQRKTVLAGIDLSLPVGTVNVVIGPSGGGKSTLLKAIAGLVEPASGSIELTGDGQSRPVIGFMPQSYGLLPWETIGDNVELAARLSLKKAGASTEDFELMEGQAHELMKQLGIEAIKDRYPSEVSGGQQQRAALARMFLLSPDILLMDEPFSALDELTRAEVREIFADLCIRSRQQKNPAKMTVLLVTHQVGEAVLLGERIIVLDGSVKAVIENPCVGLGESRYSQEDAEFSARLRELLKREGGTSR